MVRAAAARASPAAAIHSRPEKQNASAAGRGMNVGSFASRLSKICRSDGRGGQSLSDRSFFFFFAGFADLSSDITVLVNHCHKMLENVSSPQKHQAPKKIIGAPASSLTNDPVDFNVVARFIDLDRKYSALASTVSGHKADLGGMFEVDPAPRRSA